MKISGSIIGATVAAPWAVQCMLAMAEGDIFGVIKEGSFAVVLGLICVRVLPWMITCHQTALSEAEARHAAERAAEAERHAAERAASDDRNRQQAEELHQRIQEMTAAHVEATKSGHEAAAKLARNIELLQQEISS